ncbi:MAG: MFS transporter [Anaerolineae bacterium]
MQVFAIAGDYLRTVRGFNRNVRLLFVAKALLWLGGYGMWMVLFNLYLLRLGFGPEFIGLANACGLLGEAAIALPSSEIGRRCTSRRAMILGQVVCLVSFAALGFAWLLPHELRAGWLLVNCLLSSLGIAITLVNMTPFLMGATSREECNHAFSVFSAITTASGFLGALVGGLLPGLFASLMGETLAQPGPYGMALFVAALFLIPSTFALVAAQEPRAEGTCATAEPKPEPAGGRFYERAPYGLIALMTLAVLVRTLGDGTASIFWNVYFDEGLHLPTALIGTISAVGQLVAIPVALGTPLLAARFGNARTYALSVLGMALCILPLAFAPTWQVAAAGFVGMMALFSVAMPAATVYQQSLVPLRWRATMSGAVSMAFTLGWGITALAGGYVIETLGYRSLFLGGAAIVTLSVALFWLWFGRANEARTAEKAGIAK